MQTIYWTYPLNNSQLITVDINNNNILNTYGYEINSFKDLSNLTNELDPYNKIIKENIKDLIRENMT